MMTYKISAARAVRIAISKFSSWGHSGIVAEENLCPHTVVFRYGDGKGLGVTYIFPS